jgi:4-diphosphocytidyl-2-C-methyl-D-erythritol kinase
MIHERAPAKVNLLLHVGPQRADGLHELCSLVVPVDLADLLTIAETGREDAVYCPGVDEPNLCRRALVAFRAAAGAAAPRSLEVRVEKRIPVAAGLGGGSADAAAVLRAANEMSGRPLDDDTLRHLAARVGADVPSQVRPGSALVRGAGEIVEELPLPRLALVLATQDAGLSTADVYREADRIGATRERLDPEAVRALAGRAPAELAASLENDLQAAALSLRPESGERLAALERAGAMTALVTGSGPTVFGVFDDEEAARAAAARVPGGIAVTAG